MKATIALTMLAALPAFLAACGGGSDGAAQTPEPTDGSATNCEANGGSQETVPLKEAKLNIEHNATDLDTGFQGFIDSEGWQCLDVTGPDGEVLQFEGLG